MKGIIIGSCFTFTMTISSTTIAKSIDADFNLFRIKTQNGMVADLGDTYTTAEGKTNPYSIIYNDTTYLPIRKIAEVLGGDAAYNGDSKTVSISRDRIGRQYGTVVKTHLDTSNNLWEYKVCMSYDNKTKYLCVRDEARNFERVYLMLGDYLIDDDGISFVTCLYPSGGYENGPTYGVRYIRFLNSPDSQDGITMGYLAKGVKEAVAYEGKLFFVCYCGGSGMHIPVVFMFDHSFVDPDYITSGNYSISPWTSHYITVYDKTGDGCDLTITKIENNVMYIEMNTPAGTEYIEADLTKPENNLSGIHWLGH